MALPSTAISSLVPNGKTVTAIKPTTLPTTTPGQLSPVPVVKNQTPAATPTAAPAPAPAAPKPATDPTAAIKPMPAPAAPKPASPVMEAATQQALNQQAPTTLKATVDKTQQFMSETGPDLEQQKARRLAAYDAQRAKELEAIRQKTADVSNTGANLEDLTNIALEGLMNRQGLETELETSIADRRRQDAMAQIAQGQSTAKLESDIRTQGLSNLLNVQQAGEGQASREFAATQQASDQAFQSAMKGMDIEGQKALTTLKAQLDQGAQLTAQDFTASQNALDRELQKALQSGDTERQKELQALQQQFDEKMKKMDIGAEMDITKLRAALDKDSLKTQQDFTAAQNALDRELEKAMQSGDTAAQKELMTMQAAIDAKAQERGIAAQTDLAKLQASLETGKMKTAQEFEAAQNTLDRELQKAIQSGDTAKEKELLAMQQTFAKQMKETDIQAERDITSLKAALDKDQLLSQQDFQAGQSALDRELEKALFNGDTERQIELMQMKQEFDAKQTEKAQQYATAERIATQSYATTERMSSQDFDAAQAYLDREQQAALQNNDIVAQERLAKLNNELQITRDTNAMNHDEKMAYLGAQIDEAKAKGDFERQYQLLDYQTKADFQKLKSEQGFEAAQADLNRKMEQYIKEGDWKSASMMQKAEIAARAEEGAKDRALEQVRIKMAEKQMNTDKLEATFAQISAAEEAGQIAPGAAAAYLNKFIVDNPDLQIEAPDPNAVFKALDQDFAVTMKQYAQTHPEAVRRTDPATGEVQLTADGVNGFNDWFNQTVYGSNGLGGTNKGENLSPADKGNIAYYRGMTTESPEYVSALSSAAKIAPGLGTGVVVRFGSQIGKIVGRDATTYTLELPNGTTKRVTATDGVAV